MQGAAAPQRQFVDLLLEALAARPFKVGESEHPRATTDKQSLLRLKHAFSLLIASLERFSGRRKVSKCSEGVAQLFPIKKGMGFELHGASVQLDGRRQVATNLKKFSKVATDVGLHTSHSSNERGRDHHQAGAGHGNKHL